MLKQIVLALVLMCIGGLAHGQEAPKPTLKIGTEWVMRRDVSADGAPRLFRYAVARTERWQGRSYYVITRNELEAWLAEETLSLTRVLRDGAGIDFYQPDWADWRWPLFVGKSWSSDYRRTFQGVVEPTAHAEWRVVAYDIVTVPAGTYRAFRIERTPGANTVYSATRWYAPSLGLMIKQVETQTDRRGDVVEELVSYTLP